MPYVIGVLMFSSSLLVFCGAGLTPFLRIVGIMYNTLFAVAVD
jgi:hypothetical protein